MRFLGTNGRGPSFSDNSAPAHAERTNPRWPPTSGDFYLEELESQEPKLQIAVVCPAFRKARLSDPNIAISLGRTMSRGMAMSETPGLGCQAASPFRKV
jgi:hypothetical protein